MYMNEWMKVKWITPMVWSMNFLSTFQVCLRVWVVWVNWYSHWENPMSSLYQLLLTHNKSSLFHFSLLFVPFQFQIQCRYTYTPKFTFLLKIINCAFLLQYKCVLALALALWNDGHSLDCLDGRSFDCLWSASNLFPIQHSTVLYYIFLLSLQKSFTSCLLDHKICWNFLFFHYYFTQKLLLQRENVVWIRQ